MAQEEKDIFFYKENVFGRWKQLNRCPNISQVLKIEYTMLVCPWTNFS